MDSTYSGVASNVTTGNGLSVSTPSDGDAATAASLNSGPMEPTVDFAEYLYEGLIAAHIINATDNGAVNGMSQVRDVIFVNDLHLWVAVGDGGQISTSPNGKVWTAQTTGTAANCQCIAWNGSLLVVGTEDVGAHVLTSADGVTWAYVAATGSGTQIVSQVAWDDVSAVWVASVTNSTPGAGGFAIWSSDGATWHQVAIAGCLDAFGIASNGAGKFLLVGQDGGSHNAWTTTDGTSFTAQLVPGVSAVLKGVAYGARVLSFMVIDDNAVSPVSATSTSSAGTSWNSAHAGFAGNVAGPQLKWNGRAFVALISGWGIQYFIPQANTWRVGLPSYLLAAGITPLCLGVSPVDFQTLYGLDNGHVLTTLQYPYL